MDKIFLLNVGVTSASEDEVLEYIIKGLEKVGDNYYIVTPNPEILVYASKHKDFKSILNGARLACPDGIGVIWAGKILNKKFKQKVTGVDLMKKLCFEVSKKPITVGFLGGEPKIAEKTAECLLRENPGLNVVYASEEWTNEGFDFQQRYKVSSIKHKAKKKNILNTKYLIPNAIDILFVAFGFPKQEEWMADHINKIPVKVMMGVGGTFDYISGNTQRAPKPIQSLGLEWLFRLVTQPWRWRRQIALLQFIFLVIEEKFGKN